MSGQDRIRIMVSSSIHGLENLLDQVYGTLEGYGYEVWMSHKGTIPTDPRKHNFENCLDAVANCDLFLAIITGRYGSQASGQVSITHLEVQRAIQLEKLRWFLVHRDITIARQILKQFRTPDGKGWTVSIRKCPVLDDVRIIDLYEEAIQQGVPFEERKGHWVQEYYRDEDVLRYIDTQFGDLQRVTTFLQG